MNAGDAGLIQAMAVHCCVGTAVCPSPGSHVPSDRTVLAVDPAAGVQWSNAGNDTLRECPRVGQFYACDFYGTPSPKVGLEFTVLRHLRGGFELPKGGGWVF